MCYIKGAQNVIDEVSEVLDVKVDQTTDDLNFSLEATRCLGCCNLAPVMMINKDVYANITDTSNLEEILKGYTSDEA